jgi:hypothetical protein
MLFSKKYFIATSILFLVEVYIALYVHDAIIRPYIGDVLVIIFLYCLVKTFFDYSTLPLAMAVLIFAYGIETLQFLNFLNWLGLQNNRWATILLGNSFSWTDILAYTIGFVIVLLIERKLNQKHLSARKTT